MTCCTQLTIGEWTNLQEKPTNPLVGVDQKWFTMNMNKRLIKIGAGCEQGQVHQWPFKGMYKGEILTLIQAKVLQNPDFFGHFSVFILTTLKNPSFSWPILTFLTEWSPWLWMFLENFAAFHSSHPPSLPKGGDSKVPKKPWKGEIPNFGVERGRNSERGNLF